MLKKMSSAAALPALVRFWLSFCARNTPKREGSLDAFFFLTLAREFWKLNGQARSTTTMHASRWFMTWKEDRLDCTMKYHLSSKRNKWFQ